MRKKTNLRLCDITTITMWSWFSRWYIQVKTTIRKATTTTIFDNIIAGSMVTNTKNLLLLVRKLDNILDDSYETLFVGMCLPTVFTNSTLLASISIPNLHVTMHVSKIGTIDKHGVRDFRKFKELFCSMFHIFHFLLIVCISFHLFHPFLRHRHWQKSITSFYCLSQYFQSYYWNILSLENMHVFIYLNVFHFWNLSVQLSTFWVFTHIPKSQFFFVTPNNFVLYTNISKNKLFVSTKLKCQEGRKIDVHLKVHRRHHDKLCCIYTNTSGS